MLLLATQLLRVPQQDRIKLALGRLQLVRRHRALESHYALP
jgi:hypothetical protein